MTSIKIFPLNDIDLMRLEIERLSGLVGELSQKLHQSALQEASSVGIDSGILVYESKVNKYIKYDELIMIKSESNYSIIFYKNGNSIFTSRTLKYWEERCDVDYLKRVHKSYMINIKMIKSIELKSRTIFLEEGQLALYSRSCKSLISDLKRPQKYIY